MDWFTFIALLVSGFTACAEFGSFAFVHPVIKQLPPKYYIIFEQGLLKTFGRIMPILMPLTAVLVISYLIDIWSLGGTVRSMAILAAVSCSAAIVSTVIFNVPINLSTGKWDASNPPKDWQIIRNKWEWAQGLRSWLFLIGFFFLVASVAAQIS